MKVLSDPECMIFLSFLDDFDHPMHETGLHTLPLELSPHDWKKARNVLAILFMLDAGLRVGEVIGVTYNDAFFQNGSVHTLILRSCIAKRHKEREIPLTDRLRFALQRFCPGRLLIENFPLTQKLISRTPQGPALTTRAIEKMTENAGMKSLHFPVHPHMLRHTWATRLLKLTDIRTVQILLGHAHLSSTQIYTHPNSDDMKNAIQKLNTVV